MTGVDGGLGLAEALRHLPRREANHLAQEQNVALSTAQRSEHLAQRSAVVEVGLLRVTRCLNRIAQQREPLLPEVVDGRLWAIRSNQAEKPARRASYLSSEVANLTKTCCVTSCAS